MPYKLECFHILLQDNLNARSAGDEELHKLEMVDRINQCMLVFSALSIVGTIMFTMLFIAAIA